MKAEYIKFSDERRKEFCIKTLIGYEGDKRIVLKQPIFKEGMTHIRQIGKNSELLRDSYDIRPCNWEMLEDGISFEYVDGVSLEEEYNRCLQAEDVEGFRLLLDRHRKILLGKAENECIFEPSDRFEEIFGQQEVYAHAKALRCCNFDGIPSNIIFREGESVFIDYEWVFNFPIPVDLLLYHCIIDLYFHQPGFEQLMKLQDVLAYWNIQQDPDILAKSYEHFHQFIIMGEDNCSYGLVKAICLKPQKTYCDLKKELEEQSRQIGKLNSRLYEEQKRNLQLEDELENVKQELKKVAERNSALNYELEQRNKIIEEIQQSKTWKIMHFMQGSKKGKA